MARCSTHLRADAVAELYEALGAEFKPVKVYSGINPKLAMDALNSRDESVTINIIGPLSKFIDKYCDATMAEALIRWFRTYDRISIVDGLLSLDTDKKIDTKNIEKHFTKEIDKIIEEQIGL